MNIWKFGVPIGSQTEERQFHEKGKGQCYLGEYFTEDRRTRYERPRALRRERPQPAMNATPCGPIVRSGCPSEGKKDECKVRVVRKPVIMNVVVATMELHNLQ